jgi:hypothetical protein
VFSRAANVWDDDRVAVTFLAQLGFLFHKFAFRRVDDDDDDDIVTDHHA